MRVTRPALLPRRGELPTSADIHTLSNFQRSGSTLPRRVLSRCKWGYPQVVLTNAVKGQSDKAQTRHVANTVAWLTCPRVRDMVSRMEQVGTIRKYEETLNDGMLQHDYQQWDKFLQEELDSEEYKQWKQRNVHGNAGVRHASSLKCLHAHTASFLAGAETRVGEVVFRELCKQHNVVDLDCPSSCVKCKPNK